jgi:hypothetical protein
VTTFRDLANQLGAIVNLLDKAHDAGGFAKLPAEISLSVVLTSSTGDDKAKTALIDLVAEHVTGDPAAFDRPGGGFASYQTSLTLPDSSRIFAAAYVQKTDETAELQARLAAAEAKLAEIHKTSAPAEQKAEVQ